MVSNFDNINIQNLGQRLQQARKQRGLTQAEAAKIIDAARTTMVAIEKGERRIQKGELIKLARAYGHPVSDFIVPKGVSQPFSVQFRMNYKDKVRQQDEIETSINLFEDLCSNYQELENILGSPLPKNYPSEYQVERMPIDAAAESIAIAERQRLGLGDAPVPLLRDFLEQSVGLRIFYVKMPSQYSGLYTYDQALGGCIAINAVHPEERRRMSLAHEYLHFLAHRFKTIVDDESQYKRKPASERLADTFATYFMMPTSGILKHFNDMTRESQKFTPANLFTLAHHYGVALEALVLRLEEMQLLSTGTWERLKERGLKVREVQTQLALETLPQRSDTTPIHYQHLAIEALNKGAITEGHFASLLKIDRLQARETMLILKTSSPSFLNDSNDIDLCQV